MRLSVTIEAFYLPMIVFRVNDYWKDVASFLVCGHACFLIWQSQRCCICHGVKARCRVCREREAKP